MMSAHGALEYNSLSWVKKQLDAVLTEAQSFLSEYIEDSSNEDAIKECIERLKLVYGTLQMVEVYGASMLAEEMEQTAIATLENRVDNRDDVFDVLMRAMLQLPDYLEGLQAGNKDSAIALMPLINDLRAARKESLLSESVLMFPDFKVVEDAESDAEATRVEAGKLGAEAKRLRTHFQLGLLDVLRNNKQHAGYQRMLAVVAALEKVTAEPSVRRLWSVIAALLEALVEKGIDTSISVKMLLGGIDRQIRLLVDNGEEQFTKGYSQDLLKNILYYIGHSTGTGKRQAHIKALYKLDTLMPAAAVDTGMGGLNAELFSTVSRGIKEDIAKVKDVLEIFVHKEQRTINELEPLLEQLGRIGDTFGMLGLGATRQKVLDQRDKMESIIHGSTEFSEHTLEEIANELLGSESDLNNYIAQRSGYISKDDALGMIPAAEYRDVLSTVVKQALQNFADAREAILAYLAGMGDQAHLENVIQLLEEVRGVSLMLSMGPVESMLSKLKDYVGIVLIDNRYQPDIEEQDTIADVITSVEYFLEAMSEGRPGVEQGLQTGTAAADRLVEVCGAFSSVMPGESEAPLELVTENQPETEYAESVDDEATAALADEAEPAQAEAGQAVVESAVQAEAPESAETATAADQSGAEQYEILAADADDEILEIFIEEALEVLDELHGNLPALRSNPNDEEALTVVRRCFHTLKGSGRLVGAQLIGEFSWKFENMLNRVLDARIELDNSAMQALDEAVAVIPQLVEQLQGNREPVPNVYQLMAVADAIAEGRAMPEPPAAAEEPVPSFGERVAEEQGATGTAEAGAATDEERIPLEAASATAGEPELLPETGEVGATGEIIEFRIPVEPGDEAEIAGPEAGDDVAADEVIELETPEGVADEDADEGIEFGLAEALGEVDQGEVSADEEIDETVMLEEISITELQQDEIEERPPESSADETATAAETVADLIQTHEEISIEESPEDEFAVHSQDEATGLSEESLAEPAATDTGDAFEEFDTSAEITPEVEGDIEQGIEAPLEETAATEAGDAFEEFDTSAEITPEVEGDIDQGIEAPLEETAATDAGDAFEESDTAVEITPEVEGDIDQGIEAPLVETAATDAGEAFDKVDTAAETTPEVEAEIDQGIEALPVDHEQLVSEQDEESQQAAGEAVVEAEAFESGLSGTEDTGTETIELTEALESDEFDYDEALPEMEDEGTELVAEMDAIPQQGDFDEAALEVQTGEGEFAIEIDESIPEQEETANLDNAAHMDPVLFRIYYDESLGHLQLVRDLLAQHHDQNQPLVASKDLVRAFHTLYGSARTAEIDQIAELCGAMEKYLKVRQESEDLTIPDDIVQLIADVERRTDAMLEEIRTGATPAYDRAMLDRINKVVQAELQNQLQRSSRMRLVDSEAPEHTAEPLQFEQPGTETHDGTVGQSAGVLISYSEIDDDLIDIFLEEADELLESCEESLLRITQNPGDIDSIRQLQRYMHTLKGGARMAELTPVGDLTHMLESLVVKVADSQISADKVLFDLLNESLDRLASMLKSVKVREPVLNAADLVAQLEILIKGEIPEKRTVERFDIEIEDLEAGDDDSEQLEHAVEDDDANAGPESVAEEIPFGRRASDEGAAQPVAEEVPDEKPHWGERATDVSFRDSQEQIRVRADLLNMLVNSAGEVTIYHARMGKQMTDIAFNLTELEATVTRLKEQLRNMEIETEIQIRSTYAKETDHYNQDFDPLEMDRYSTLQQLSRSLTESAGDVESIKDILNDIVRDSETLLMQESRVSNALQEGLMRTRMVRFGGLATRLRRIVRQTSKELGKEVVLEIVGENNEVDRTVLDRIIAPLEHMLRNAVAHGIETPRQRLDAGKPESGTIIITVDREGADVIIRVEDDGAGINVDAIREKAIAMGMLEENNKLSDHDVLQLIMTSGFSTAKNVTQVSGRGVGMDVVDAEIKQLGGILEISTRKGRGTVFNVRLPLTLAINQALLVNAGDDIYAVPLASIQGVVRITGSELQRFYESENLFYEFNNVQYELKHLGKVLTGQQPDYSRQFRLFPVLLVKVGDQHFALHVDDLVGRREIVVKPVGAQISSVRGIAGATILADGRVVLILEMSSLVVAESLFKATEEAVEAEPAPRKEKKEATTIMVVDDSITIRKVTARMLERNGIQVLLAKDGVDATNMLQDHMPDLMLLDIEMPRMDGFELASYIRNDERLKQLPIIMITSRTGTKHKEKAMEIGVNEYLGKPYQEEELMMNINKILEVNG